MFRRTILTLAASAALGMAALAPTIASADGMNDRKDYGGYDRKDYGEYDRKDDYQGYGKGYQSYGHPHGYGYGYKVISKPWYVYKPSYGHKPWFAYKPHDFHRGYKFGGYKFGGWNYGKYGYRSY